jgi:hypothetical protein
MNTMTHVEIMHKTGYPMAYGEFSTTSDIFECIARLQIRACKRYKIKISQLVTCSELCFRLLAA